MDCVYRGNLEYYARFCDSGYCDAVCRVSKKNVVATKRIRGWKWMQIRKRILARDPICVKCKEKGIVSESKEVDHIIPLDFGGSNRDDNLQGLCVPCHVAKTNYDFGKNVDAGSDVNGMPLDPNHFWNR